MSTTRARGNTLRIKTSSNFSIIRVVLIAGVGVIATALLIKLIKRGRKVSSGGRVTEDQNVQLAMDLYTAIGSWYEPADKDEIFRIGSNIKNYDDVAREYNNLYDESLSHDLQNALDDEWPEFIGMVTKVENKTDVMSSSEVQKLVISLHDDMTGFNWIGHKVELYQQLYRLPDADFKKVIAAYDVKYMPDYFAQTLKDETLVIGHPQRGSFYEFKDGILSRISELF